MKAKTKFIILTISVMVVIAACSQIMYIPTNEDAQRAGESLETLNQGKMTYEKNSAKCHGLFSPERFTQQKWAKIMPVMQKKAKISNEEASLISKYVNARAKQN